MYRYWYPLPKVTTLLKLGERMDASRAVLAAHAPALSFEGWFALLSPFQAAVRPAVSVGPDGSCTVMIFDEENARLLGFLHYAGEEGRIVGQFVRDVVAAIEGQVAD